MSLADLHQMSYSGRRLIDLASFLDCDTACVKSLKSVNVQPLCLRHDVIGKNIRGFKISVLLPKTGAKTILSLQDRTDRKVLAGDPTLIAHLDVGRPRGQSSGCRAGGISPWGGS